MSSSLSFLKPQGGRHGSFYPYSAHVKAKLKEVKWIPPGPHCGEVLVAKEIKKILFSVQLLIHFTHCFILYMRLNWHVFPDRLLILISSRRRQYFRQCHPPHCTSETHIWGSLLPIYKIWPKRQLGVSVIDSGRCCFIGEVHQVKAVQVLLGLHKHVDQFGKIIKRQNLIRRSSGSFSTTFRFTGFSCIPRLRLYFPLLWLSLGFHSVFTISLQLDHHWKWGTSLYPST